MSTITGAYVNAVLADASYAKGLADGMTGADLQDKLRLRMTTPLAKFIGDSFTVVTAIDTSDGLLAGSGFDAVVWRGNAGTPYAGRLLLYSRAEGQRAYDQLLAPSAPRAALQREQIAEAGTQDSSMTSHGGFALPATRGTVGTGYALPSEEGFQHA